MAATDPIDPIAAEYRWCWQQTELLARHPGQVLVFHNRTFLGSGADHYEARENARQRAAEEGKTLPVHGLLFLVVPESLDTDWDPFPVLPDE